MVLKLRVILTSGPITLPDDWNGTDCRLWAWGAGGRASNQQAGSLSSMGGGGGGGFAEALNVGGSPGDVWTADIAIGGAGKSAANRTKVTTAALAVLVTADSGANAGGLAGIGGIGGSGGSLAASNRGGDGDFAGGGGGGGGAPGPHTSKGMRGGDGLQVSGGGGGGGGACGSFDDNDESLATDGNDAVGFSGADGGDGYYGTGAGVGGTGGAGVGTDGGAGDSNTGGGGGGGGRTSTDGTDGGAGASWDYILGLTPDTWITSPFTWTTTASTRWAELSNGSVPAGGGGGGGGRLDTSSDNPGRGGNGGFPGGGGGGGGFGNDPRLGIGGDGADGLLLIFYEGEDEPEPEPETEGCDTEDEADELAEAIVWPKCNLVPTHIDVQIVAPTVSPGRSLTSHERPIQPDAGFWRILLKEIKAWSETEILLWREIESTLNGRNKAILIPFYEAPLSSTAVVAECSELALIGQVRIVITKLAGAHITAGTHFSAGDWGYRIERVFGTVGGVTSVLIWPPLRADIVQSEALDFNTPRVRCRLERDDGMNINLQLLRFGMADVAFVEDV